MNELQAALQDAEDLVIQEHWWTKIYVDEDGGVSMDIGLIGFDGRRQTVISNRAYYRGLDSRIRYVSRIHS